MKPFWEILVFLPTFKLFPFGPVAHNNETILRNLRISHHFEKSLHFSPLQKSKFSSGQVAHYNKTTLKNLCIFYHFEKSSHFSPLWKILYFWKKSLYFSKPFIRVGRPLQQDNFEKSLHFSPFWEIFAFLTTLKNLLIFHHFEKPGQVAHYNKTTLKNLCIFHHFEKSPHFHHFENSFHLGMSPITTRLLWKIFVFFTTLKNLHIFTWVGHPL